MKLIIKELKANKKPFLDLNGDPIKFNWYLASRKESGFTINFEFGSSADHEINGNEIDLKIELFEKNGKKHYKEVI